jgi:ribonuclease HIII
MVDRMSDPKVIQGMKDYAKYIAIVVRNAMEDFHCKHLSDRQMKELNPIIRNAIYSAIYAYETQKHSDLSKQFVEYHFMSIPKYWEEPELLGGLKE